MEKFLTVFLVVSIMFYIVGSFMWSSFNIAEWDQNGKYILGGINLGVTLLSGFVISIQKLK